MTLTFAAAGTAASLQALTQGAPNQDFAIVGGGSCVEGQGYQAGATCTEVVSFTPKAAGLRRGAVVIADGSGNQLAVAYVGGVGSGPQAGLRASVPPVSFAGIGLSIDKGIAVDGAGDLFVASENITTAKDTVYEVPSSCNQAACIKQLPGAFGAVWGLAVDGAGNLWVGDREASGTITEMFAAGGYSTAKSYSGAFGNQIGVAVDGSGNVLFLSASPSSFASVIELTSASSYTTGKTVAIGVTSPGGIAVDSVGDVFYIDSSIQGIQELAAVNGSLPATPTVQTVGSGIKSPVYLAVDGSDSLFVTTLGGFIEEVPAAGGYSTSTQYSNQFAAPSGIAIDEGGDLFVSVLVAGLNNQFEEIETGKPFEIPRTAAAALSFSTPTAPGEVDSADGSETVWLENTGNQSLDMANLAISDSDFSFVNSTTCSASTTLVPGASCVLGMQFDPTAIGNPVTATVTLTNNAQNAVSGQQTISLSGTSLYTPTLSAAGPNVIAVSRSLTLTITVHGANAGPIPTGTIQVSGDGYSGSALPLSNGKATVTIPAGSLTAGAANLTVLYQPDTAGALNYLPLQGQDAVTVTQSLENQPQVQVLPAVGSISTGQALTVQVNVLQVNGSPVPTGTVTLSGGSYTSGAVTLIGASASFTIPANSLPLGIDGIVAAYTPDAASASIYLGTNGGALVDVSAAALPAGAVPAAFGSLGIGTASAATPVTLVFPLGGTPASLVATTQGAAGLDFALASGGSCAAGAYVPPGQSCTVNVIFAPAFPGLRNGAVSALDVNGFFLAMTYIYGTGTGAQLAIESVPGYELSGGNANMFPTGTTPLTNGYSWPRATVDGGGNVYVADEGNSRIQKIPAGCASNSCAVTVTTGIVFPAGMTVDGAGNLFVTELGFNDVKEIPLGCRSISCMVTVGTGFSQPNGVAVDSSGNVFVADTGNGAIKEVVAAGGYATINDLATGLDSPWSVAVDSSDNLFVAQGGDECQVWIPGTCNSINTSIIEITAASGYKTVNTLIGNNALGKPLGVTIDGSGNVYEADYGDACSNEISAGSGYQQVQGWCLNSDGWVLTGAVALGRESNGGIVWGDVNTGAVSLTQFNQSPSIVFKTAVPNGTSDYNDGTQFIYLLNNGNVPLALSGMTLSAASFQFDSATTTCTTSKPLAAGRTCLIGVDFAPDVYGPISATLTLTSNNMNQSGTTQVIPITAVALPPTPVILTTPPNSTSATSAVFAFSDTQAPITFVCSIDSLPFSACASPYTYSALSGGQHTFQVKAQDGNGNLSPAAIFSWTVNSVGPPAPVITSGPSPVSLTPAASFTFTDSRSGVSFQCSLDGAAFAPCNSGVSYTVTGATGYGVLAHHTFAVEAEDASSNVSPEATYAWNYVLTPTNGEGSSSSFGSVAVGQISAPVTITFNTNGQSANHPTDIVASIATYAMGVASQEFAVTDPGTCAVGDTVTLGGSCTLSATFTPKYPGQRKGAVALFDANGLQLGLAYLQGTGTAPQLTFSPYSTDFYNLLAPQNNSNPGKDLVAATTSLALDGAGNLYVSDGEIGSIDQSVLVSVGDIWKFAPGCYSSSCSTLFATNGRTGSSVPNTGGLIYPLGIDVDGAGLMWVSNGELAPSLIDLNAGVASQLCGLGSSFFGQTDGVAVDGAGLASMVENGGVYLCGTLLGTFSLSSNTPAITVDPQGDIFVADEGNNAVGEVLASSNYTIARTVGSGFSKPQGVTSDAYGNIYVADTGNSAIMEMTAASGYTQIATVATFNPSTVTPGNLTVDPQGNLYTVNLGSATNEVVKIDLADAPALSFATSTQVGSTDTTDGTLTATVKNNGNAPLTISGLTIAGSSFQLDASATTCAAGTTVDAGSSCTIGAIFEPQASGALTGSVTLTDNALNAAGSTQVFALSGTGFTTPTTVRPTVTVMPANDSVTTAQSDVVMVSVTGRSGSPTPTGSVTLSGGDYTSASVTLAGGSATITIPVAALALGNNTINAIYAPDTAASATYGAATDSTTITVTSVAKSTPTVGLAPALLDVSTSQSLQVAIVVTAGAGNPTPTGSVTLSGGNFASLAVTLANGTASITIPSGYLPSGMVTLAANYTPDAPGAANFNSASGATQVDVEAAPLITPGVAVMPGSNSIAVTQPLGVTVAVSGGNGNPVATGTIMLSAGSYSSPAATISEGSVVLTVPAGALTGGSNTLSAVYTPDKASALTYNSATGVASVTGATTGQTIVFAQPASPITYSPGLTVPLTATGGASGNPVIFSIDASSTGTGSISGSTLTVTSAGTLLIDANQGGNSNYSSAPQVQRTIAITQAAQAITFTQPTSPATYSQGLTVPLLATGGGSGNPVVFSIDASSTGTGSISGSTLNVTSTGTFVIDANQAGNTNYSAAPQVQRTLVVNALTAQSITFAQPTSPIIYAPGLTVPLSASGGASGNPVAFSIDASSTAAGSISGSTLTVISAGTLVIDANQAGNSSYSAASQVQRSMVVALAPQTINFTPPATPITYASGLTIPLSATGGASGNAVVFAIDASSTATGSISGSTLTVVSAGTFVIDANQDGNVNYLAAPQVQRTVVVNALPPDFMVSTAPAALTIAPGGSGTITVTIASINGSFSNAVNLSLSGLPAGVTGNFSSSSITPGSTSATLQLTISASNMAALSKRASWPISTPALALLVLLPLGPWSRSLRPRMASRLLAVLLGVLSLSSLAALSGCGGGFALVPPAATSPITITATSGTDNHSTTVQLTVQ